MHQSMVVISPILSTCRFQRPPRVQKPQSFLYCDPTYVCMAPKSCIPFQFIKPQSSVGDWLFMLWKKWKTFSALFGIYIYCMFRILDCLHCSSLFQLSFRLHGRWVIFAASEICFWEITEARASCCVQKKRCRINIHKAEDMSEDIWRLYLLKRVACSWLEIPGNVIFWFTPKSLCQESLQLPQWGESERKKTWLQLFTL